MREASHETELQQAFAYYRAGRLRDAETLYRRILARDPDRGDAWYFLGRIAHEIRQYENAVTLFKCAIICRSDVAQYHDALGEALSALGEHEGAVCAYEQACLCDPKYAEAHSNRGIALHTLGRLDEAINAFEHATRVQPDFAAGYYNLGNALQEAGRIEQAGAAYAKAIELAPQEAEIHNNLGVALVDQLKVREAMTAFAKAIQLKPDFAEAHANKGMALLLSGEFTQGWREHSWRFGCAEQRRRSAQDSFNQPQWDGGDFAGKTLLVHTEQGLGDTIQFIRYLPMVRAKGGRVLFACQPDLHRLFVNLAGVDALLGDPRSLPAEVAFDMHVPLLELPRLFGTELETIPQQVPYLTVNAATVAAWHSRIASESYNVGICWAGRPTHPNDRNRSIALATLAPLARVPGVTFYSLQKGAAAEQARQPPASMELIDYSGDLHDFTDTAALIMNLDLVISVDTAPVHVSGALARPVWTLLPFAPDWRWLRDRADSPWYPTMRLFRQPRIGDWKAVIEQVAISLEGLVR